MKTSFNVTASHELVSSLLSRTEPHQLTVGTAVYLAKPYNTGFGVVRAGSKGTVVHVDDYNGTIEIRMKAFHRALAHWGNTLVISPYTCEDLSTSIKLSVDKPPPIVQILVPEGGTQCLMAAC